MAESSHLAANTRPLILLIEDYVDLREMIAAALEHGGYRTLALNSGDDVLTTPRDTLMEARFALVDDSLPGQLTGAQTVALLHLINPRIKVFPIPGRPLTEYEHALIAGHYRQILLKPFGLETLLAAIKLAAASL